MQHQYVNTGECVLPNLKGYQNFISLITGVKMNHYKSCRIIPIKMLWLLSVSRRQKVGVL